MDSHLTIIDTSIEEIEVKKSRFIGIAFHCESEDELLEHLDRIKRKFPNARHYCYAFRYIDNIIIDRYQDDKEPSGTAGVPILEVLKGQELLQTAIVVVRYFGGTLLGTGGLSRAYSDAARLAIEEANIVNKQSASLIEIEVDYSTSGKLEYFIASNKLALIQTNYSDNVTYELAIPTMEKETEINTIIQTLNNKCKIKEIRETKGYFKENEFEEY